MTTVAIKVSCGVLGTNLVNLFMDVHGYSWLMLDTADKNHGWISQNLPVESESGKQCSISKSL
jgi:hypothetical protein